MRTSYGILLASVKNGREVIYIRFHFMHKVAVDEGLRHLSSGPAWGLRQEKRKDRALEEGRYWTVHTQTQLNFSTTRSCYLLKSLKENWTYI